jgi:hypothetical protein
MRAIILEEDYSSEHKMENLCDTMSEREGVWTDEKWDHELQDMEEIIVDPRGEDEHKCFWDYHGMMHNIAKKGFMKTIGDETEYSRTIFNNAVSFLDKIEERFDPTKERTLRLPKSDYRACKRWQKVINLQRFKLYNITYEQWAYLANWLNVLLSNEDLDGIIKQYPSEMQGIKTDELWIDEEELEWEVKEVFYSRS